MTRRGSAWSQADQEAAVVEAKPAAEADMLLVAHTFHTVVEAVVKRPAGRPFGVGESFQDSLVEDNTAAVEAHTVVTAEEN